MLSLSSETASSRNASSVAGLACGAHSYSRHRVQGTSRLADLLARVLGVPMKALTIEGLTGETLDSPRERFGFDPD
jgi:hypothetical protein